MKRVIPNVKTSKLVSPPARGRGLKPNYPNQTQGLFWSPPARGRGLKHYRRVLQQMDAVAPRTGAWIETKSAAALALFSVGRPPHGGVD